MPSSSQKSVILLAHGSRDPHWTAPFEQLLSQLQSELQQTQPEAKVELAYMELAEPSLATSIAKLYAQGCREFEVLPLFFAAGRHLRHDVPKLLAQLQEEYQRDQQAIRILLHPPVGQDPKVAQAIAQVVQQTLVSSLTAQP